ncbi:MAG: NADPH-dependent 7-cyano-7-deazaguanine reductase QueF [Leptospirales bacterium]
MAESISSRSTGEAPLGKATDYPTAYDPGLLFSIPRKESRATLGLSPGDHNNVGDNPSARDDREIRPLPFHGADLWNAYEVSWLGPTGKPEIRAAQLRVPCESQSIVESKSLKLYLNSLNQHRFDSPEAARATIEKDLSRAAGAAVATRFFTPTELSAKAFPTQASRLAPRAARCLDDLELAVSRYGREPSLLRTTPNESDPRDPEGRTDGDGPHTQNTSDDAAILSVYTDLFKSNCPVTGQPDWASVFVEYAGAPIDDAGLLAYLISYRNEQDFHEHCVEQIFVDIQERCDPKRLTVCACFLRRGGLDINPFRSNFQEAPQFLRSARQ